MLISVGFGSFTLVFQGLVWIFFRVGLGFISGLSVVGLRLVESLVVVGLNPELI